MNQDELKVKRAQEARRISIVRNRLSEEKKKEETAKNKMRMESVRSNLTRV